MVNRTKVFDTYNPHAIEWNDRMKFFHDICPPFSCIRMSKIRKNSLTWPDLNQNNRSIEEKQLFVHRLLRRSNLLN